MTRNNKKSLITAIIIIGSILWVWFKNQELDESNKVIKEQQSNNQKLDSLMKNSMVKISSLSIEVQSIQSYRQETEQLIARQGKELRIYHDSIVDLEKVKSGLLTKTKQQKNRIADLIKKIKAKSDSINTLKFTIAKLTTENKLHLQALKTKNKQSILAMKKRVEQEKQNSKKKIAETIKDQHQLQKESLRKIAPLLLVITSSVPDPDMVAMTRKIRAYVNTTYDTERLYKDSQFEELREFAKETNLHLPYLALLAESTGFSISNPDVDKIEDILKMTQKSSYIKGMLLAFDPNCDADRITFIWQNRKI